LLEKLDNNTNKTTVEESESSKNVSQANAKLGLADFKEKNPKNPGQLVLNKPLTQETSNSKLKFEESLSKKNFQEPPKPLDVSKSKMGKKPEESIEYSKSKKKREETNPREDTENEMTEQNDIFQSESVGLDLTIDSTAINQFDYNESVDKDD